MCKVCTEAVHCVALWTRVTLGLDMCKVCTEAVHWVALWTRVTLGLDMCKVCTEADRFEQHPAAGQIFRNRPAGQIFRNRPAGQMFRNRPAGQILPAGWPDYPKPAGRPEPAGRPNWLAGWNQNSERDKGAMEWVFSASFFPSCLFQKSL